MNGVEQTPLQLPSSYNSVKSIVGSTNNNSRDDRNSNISKGKNYASFISILKFIYENCMANIGILV